MNYLLFIVLGYLSGSILFAYYLPLWLKKVDITEGTPDGNPGAFNCIARVGKPLGLFALFCDLMKGTLVVVWAAHVLDMGRWEFALVLAAPVAGHAYSAFRRFRGGKAIAVTFGVLLGLFPVWQPFGLLAASYLFFSLVVCVRPNRYRSIITFLCFGLGSVVWMPGTAISLGCILAAGVVVSRHWEGELEEEKPTARFLLSRRGR